MRDATAGERVCFTFACLPCVAWSTFVRVACLPLDCLFGSPCGGNGCTKCSDAMCMDVVVGGRLPETKISPSSSSSSSSSSS